MPALASQLFECAKARRVEGDRMNRKKRIAAATALAIVLAAFLVAGCRFEPFALLAGADEPVDFNFQVRPILSENCFRCHGPDAGGRKAGLRLDIAAAAYAALPESPGKHAIVPGSLSKSELVRRITATDADERMPPAAAHKTLTREQIDTLTRWVQQGAEYKPHWAYIPPRKAAPPASSFAERAISPIDAFVFARLGKAGLQPSPETDRETLINRVTLDLTGVPPTPAEVDDFVADKSPKAYEKVVDRLLTSPRYGERMAEAWLDVARYAESDGYLDDQHGRLLWPWRDWVIQALNRNMPYDQFATWQLAGDLLPGATREQLLATVFGRLGKRSTENGIIDEEYRVDYVNERAELVGKAFLGLTVGCAKCHDHKYDTISQEDYYSLGAFFNSIDERGFYAAGFTNRTVGPTISWTDASTDTKLANAQARLSQQIAAFDAALGRATVRASAQAEKLLGQSPGAARALVERSIKRSTLAYYPLDGSRPPLPGEIEARFKNQRKPFFPPDSPLVTRFAEVAKSGKPSPLQRRVPNTLVENLLTFSPSATPGVAPAVFQEAELKPGIKGNAFYVSDKNIGFLAQDIGWFERSQEFGFDLWIRLPAGKVYDDATVVNHRDHNVITGDSGYTLNLEQNHLRFDLIHMSPHNMLSVRGLEALPGDQWIHVAVMYDGSSRAGGIHLYVNGAPASVEIEKDNLTRTILPTLVAGTLGGEYYGFAFGYRFRDELFTGGLIDEIRIFDRALTPLEVRFEYSDRAELSRDPAARKSELAELIAMNDPEVRAAAKQLGDARETVNAISTSAPEIMVMGDTPRARQAYLLERGVYNQHGREVSPRGLERVFRWQASLPPNRLGLARWLFDPQNPLTARVTVNRLWALHFGRGIVETVEDFGTQGSNPTHPELLDWLAVEFMNSGWDLKHMHRLMVLSATYRQSSDATPEALEKDPQNLLLARASRQRLPAETIRDNALAASGLLVDRIGGPSVYPFQPGGVWESVGSKHEYPQPSEVPNDEHHRRSLYSFIKRTAETPSMVVFDFADRNVSTVRRPLSNTPLQALVLLNDPQYREAYRALAQRALEAGGDDATRIQRVFGLALRRKPMGSEASVLADYYTAERKRFAAAPAQAAAAVSIGVSPVDSTLDPVELAALTSVAAAVLNTPDAYSTR